MAILKWPADLKPKQQQFYAIYTTRQFKSPFTGTSQTSPFPACHWNASLTLNNLDRDELRDLEVFLLQLRGAAGRFRIGDQANAEPRGLAQGTPVIDGAGQYGGVLNIRGCTPNQNFLMVGDYITINDELKRLVADANADSEGKTTLRFEPNLRKSPADGDTVITRNTYAVMRLADDKQVQTKRVPLYGSITIKLVEDIYR
ncbi:hypothetical protein [uncultured Endozoicomonas sp.]|uniref:hypothetical protein n=1 Tax=uncultured Endozoicomonas sp. TaxID=432652 RepID=UPI002607A2BA|nr:hypothetical protein [uncultured Endozoicomonas sp.]